MPNIVITATGDDVAIAALNNVAKAIDEASKRAKENADANKELGGSGIWLVDVLKDLGSSFVAHVAEGVLLRDAVREVMNAVKETAEAIPDLIEHTAELGNHLYEMSLKTGASVENLSGLRYAASQTGMDFDSLGTTFFKMEQALGSSGAKADATQAQLSRLGLNLQTLKDEKPDQAFIDIEGALEKLPNRADQANIGMAIFGRGFKDMAGLTQDNISELLGKADDLGIGMTTMSAAAGHAAEVGFTQLQLQVEAVGLKIGNALMPAVVGIENDLSVGLVNATKQLNGSLGELGGADGWLATVARAMGTGNDATKAQIKLYDDLKGVLLDLAKYTLEPLITTIGFVMTEFNAGKVVFGDVVQVLNVLALGFDEVGLYAAKALNVISFGRFKDDVAMFQGGVDAMKQKIYEQADALAANKQAETDWSTWSVNANKAVEVALTAVGNTHTDVTAKIQDFADKSVKASGDAGEAVEGGKKKVDLYKKAWEDLNSIGLTYMDTIAGIDPAIESQIEKFLRQGASVGTLTKAFPDLTEAQIKAVDDMIKATDKYAKNWETAQAAITKVWDDAAIVEEEHGQRGLTLQLSKLARQEENEKAAATKSITNEIQLVDILAAIDQKYQLERANATTKNEEDIAAKTKALWTETDTLTQKGSLTTTEYQIAQVKRWYDDQKEKAGLAGIDDKSYYDGLAALAQAKMQEVTRSHDQMFQAVHQFQEDLQENWLKNFDDTLVKTHSFKDAFVSVFDLMKSDVEHIFADLLGSVLKGFLQPLMDQVSGVASSISRALSGALSGASGSASSYIAGDIANVAGVGGGAAAAGGAGLLGAGLMSGLATAGIGAAVAGGVAILEHFIGPSEETRVVSPERDAWFAQHGNLENVNPAVLTATGSLSLVQDVFAAKTDAEFQRATAQIHNQVPGFADGTRGQFVDFGSSSLVALHGKERVTTEPEQRTSDAVMAAMHAELQGLRSDLSNMLRVQPIMLRHALRGA